MADDLTPMGPSLMDIIRQRYTGMPQVQPSPAMATTMPPVPVQEAMKSMVEPLTNAGWMLGGAMQGTERPAPSDVMKAAGGLGLALMPMGPGRAAGALERGAEAAVGGLGRSTGRISQRLPTAVRSTEDPLTGLLHANTEAMKTDPELFAHNVNILRGYPNMTLQEASLPTQGAADAFKQHVKDNLIWLHNQVPEDIRNRSQLWYDGANAIVRGRAEHYGLPEPSVAGVYAAMSPQKDWFQNVGLGDRVLHIVHNVKDPYTEQMAAKAPEIFGDPKFAPMLDAIRGKTLAEMPDSAHRAMWVRLYDQAHHDPSYNLVTPEGQMGETVKNQNGSNSRIAWGSLGEIGKAIDAIHANGDVARLSELMGERHKVRNFYNNMLEPNAPHGDVTIDTHAVAAGLLRPLSGNTAEVAQNFGNYLDKATPRARGSAITGTQGLYPLYADAYREAAQELGLQPRQLQSITWEAARGLFPDTFKSNAKNVAAINDIWHNYRQGTITADQARSLVHERAGGINPPDWHAPGGQ